VTLNEAMEQVGDMQHYQVADWAFGYKESAGNVEQKTLEVVYEFYFAAPNFEERLEYPPQTVEVDSFIRG
jgi:hypothetical protein